MIILRLGRSSAAARLWLDELPHSGCTPLTFVERAFPADGYPTMRKAAAAAEISLIYGPRRDYGMLGAEFAHEHSAHLVVRVGYAPAHVGESGHADAAKSPTLGPFGGYSGLPEEYADAILDGIANSRERETLGGGTLRYVCAAHHPYDSSSLTFSRLAKLVARLLHTDTKTLADTELTKLVSEYFAA